MLIISRKKYQKLIIADEVEITILEVGRNRVRFGIRAPKHIRIQTHQTTGLDSSDGRSDEFEEHTVSIRDLPMAAAGLFKGL